MIDSYEFHGIGIDDIVFTKSYCNHFPAQATVSPVTTKTTSTTTKSASTEINSSKKKLKNKLILKLNFLIELKKHQQVLIAISNLVRVDGNLI